MILAAILLASLNTKSAYQFVDVSNIEVTGDYQAATGERVRGEHVARFYEWLAEGRWIMNTCGATIPAALSQWTPPTPHGVVSLQPAIDAYNAVKNTISSNPVKWTGNEADDGYILCYSKSFGGEDHGDSVRVIAASAISSFDRQQYPHEISYYTMPTVTNGVAVTAADLNTINKASTANAYRWYAVASPDAFSYSDNSVATTTYGSRTYHEGSPLSVTTGYLPWRSTDPDVYLSQEMFDSSNGRFKIRGIMKANSPFELLSTEYTPDASSSALYSSNGLIAGRTGIPITSQSICFMILCWRVNYNSALDMTVNARVYAKRYTFGGSETIEDIIDGVLSRTPTPTGNSYNAYYAAILCARLGNVVFNPNAFR